MAMEYRIIKGHWANSDGGEEIAELAREGFRITSVIRAENRTVIYMERQASILRRVIGYLGIRQRKTWRHVED